MTFWVFLLMSKISDKNADRERQKETEKDRERQRETERDSERQRETERDLYYVLVCL